MMELLRRPFRLDLEDRMSLWLMVIAGAVVFGLTVPLLWSGPKDAYVQADAKAEKDCRDQAQNLRPKKVGTPQSRRNEDIAEQHYQQWLEAEVCAASVRDARASQVGSEGQRRLVTAALAALLSFVVAVAGIIFASRTARGSRVIERAYLQGVLTKSTGADGRGGHVLKVRNVGKTIARTLHYRTISVEPPVGMPSKSAESGRRPTTVKRVIEAGKQVKINVDVPWIPPGRWVLIFIGYEDVFGKPNESWFCFSCGPTGKYTLEQDGYRRCGPVGD